MNFRSKCVLVPAKTNIFCTTIKMLCLGRANGVLFQIDLGIYNNINGDPWGAGTGI